MLLENVTWVQDKSIPDMRMRSGKTNLNIADSDTFSNSAKEDIYTNQSKQFRVLTSPDIERVEVGAVEDPEPKPGEEEDEESVVEVADAVAGKHAVVLSL